MTDSYIIIKIDQERLSEARSDIHSLLDGTTFGSAVITDRHPLVVYDIMAALYGTLFKPRGPLPSDTEVGLIGPELERKEREEARQPPPGSHPDAYVSPEIRTTLSQRFDRMPRLGELESFVDRCLGSGMTGPTTVQVNATSSARETFVALSATKSEERE